MSHRASHKFWQRYDALPSQVRSIADSAFVLLKDDARHPSLQLKVVGKYWSVRVRLHYHALAIEEAGELVWFWIGHHTEYDRLIRSQ